MDQDKINANGLVLLSQVQEQVVTLSENLLSTIEQLYALQQEVDRMKNKKRNRCIVRELWKEDEEKVEKK